MQFNTRETVWISAAREALNSTLTSIHLKGHGRYYCWKIMRTLHSFCKLTLSFHQISRNRNTYVWDLKNCGLCDSVYGLNLSDTPHIYSSSQQQQQQQQHVSRVPCHYSMELCCCWVTFNCGPDCVGCCNKSVAAFCRHVRHNQIGCDTCHVAEARAAALLWWDESINRWSCGACQFTMNDPAASVVDEV